MQLDIFQTGPLDVNTYVLKDDKTKQAVLIDVGGEFEELKEKLNEQGYEIKYILNTHGHFDHVLGEAQVQEKYPDLKIYINSADEKHYSDLTKTLEYWGFGDEVPSLKPSFNVDETSELYIGDTKIEVIETPGHSKGSVSYYAAGMLFSGDALFCGSIGRTDFIDGDFHELITSIKTKLFVLPDDTVVYPGHGPSTTIKNEKLANPYLK